MSMIRQTVNYADGCEVEVYRSEYECYRNYERTQLRYENTPCPEHPLSDPYGTLANPHPAESTERCPC